MPASPIIVRPLASPTEYKLHFEFADQAFSPDPSPDNALGWQQVVTTRPDYRPEQLRGAFRDGEQLGSYIIYERMLRMGTAQHPFAYDVAPQLFAIPEEIGRAHV